MWKSSVSNNLVTLINSAEKYLTWNYRWPKSSRWGAVISFGFSKWIEMLLAAHYTKDRRHSGFMKSRYCIDKEKCDVENKKKRLQKRPIISFHIEPFLTCIYLLFFFGWKYTIKCMFFNQTLNMNGILIPNPYCTTNTCTIYRVITIQCSGSMCVPPVCSLETELMCCCCCRMHSNYMFIWMWGDKLKRIERWKERAMMHSVRNIQRFSRMFDIRNAMCLLLFSIRLGLVAFTIN